MSYKDIAQSLNMSEELVKISLYRARKKIKELTGGIKQMKPTEEINALLVKYWKGETSLEEEDSLTKYFTGRDCGR